MSTGEKSSLIKPRYWCSVACLLAGFGFIGCSSTVNEQKPMTEGQTFQRLFKGVQSQTVDVALCGKADVPATPIPRDRTFPSAKNRDKRLSN
jgi:hypothetical protein